MASTERLQVVIDAQNNTRQAFSGARSQIAKTQQKMRRVGRQMQQVGTKMTQFVSLPLAAAGAAATKFAADFEQNLKQTRSQIDATVEETEKIGEAVEDIAVRTGKATDEIFDAMRIAQSSTLSLAEANELVEGAALGAASGLGKMKTLVNLGTTAANKFGDSVESARRGMEVMAAAAQQSETSVDQFAGGLLKGSSGMEQLGISMQEGAAIFSRLSSSARNAKAAGTQFRAFLTKLAKPTKDMTGLMADVFGGVQQFRKEMDKNAIGTLFELRDAMEKSNKTTATFLGSVRAVGGASNLFASNLQEVNETLDKTTDSQGLLLEMFKASESFTRLTARAFQALKAAIRPIGDAIINRISEPLSAFIAQAQKFADWFETLPSSVKSGILAVTAFAIALGPAIAILGTFSILLGSISATAGAVAAAIAGVGAVVFSAATNWQKFKNALSNVFNTLRQSALFTTLKTNLKLLWFNIKKRLLPALRSFWANHGKKVKTLMSALAQVAGGVLLVALNGIVTVINLFIAAVDGLVRGLDKFIKLVSEKYGPEIKKLGQILEKFLVKPIEFLIDLFKDLKSRVNSAMEKLIDFREVASGMGDSALGNLADSFGGAGGIFDFSGSFDSGGVVPGPIGKPRLAKVHAGETILPTHKQGFAAGGDIIINQRVEGDVSGREVIEKVKQGLMSELERETKISLQ